MIRVHTKNHEFDNAYLRPIPGVVLSCTECQGAMWMLLLSVASKGTINAESLKVLLLTSFKFTKLSLSNPTSNLCLFNCKTIRYWFILVWCSMNSVNIRAHYTSWTNTLVTYIQGSKKLSCARMRSAVVMAPGEVLGFRSPSSQPFPCFHVETREWRDILISYIVIP